VNAQSGRLGCLVALCSRPGEGECLFSMVKCRLCLQGWLEERYATIWIKRFGLPPCGILPFGCLIHRVAEEVGPALIWWLVGKWHPLITNLRRGNERFIQGYWRSGELLRAALVRGGTIDEVGMARTAEGKFAHAQRGRSRRP